MMRSTRALLRVASRGVRSYAQSGHAPAAAAPASEVKVPEGVVVPEVVTDLTWLLDTPPNLHEFEEPPVF